MPSDRSTLIRLASSLPKGSDERRAVLAGLKSAWQHPKLQGFSKGDRVKFGWEGHKGTIVSVYRDRGIEFADIQGDDGTLYDEIELAGIERIR